MALALSRCGSGGRVVAVGLGALAAILVLKKVLRMWRDRIALADLLVSLGNDVPVLRKDLPLPLVEQFAKIFSRVFADSRMYEALYQGDREWRKTILEDLFKVHTIIAASYGKARFFVDEKKRKKFTRIPVATCFASLYSSKAPQPGLFDVICAGGIPVFMQLGNSFSRSYKFENWLLQLRSKVAGDREYLCIDHLFVREPERSNGLGSRMMRHLIEEAEERKLPLLVTVADEEVLPFFNHYGFQVVHKETYDAVTADGSDRSVSAGKPMPFDIWMLMRNN